MGANFKYSVYQKVPEHPVHGRKGEKNNLTDKSWDFASFDDFKIS